MTEPTEEEFASGPPDLKVRSRERSTLYQLIFDFPRFAERFLTGGVFTGPVWFLFLFTLGVSGVIDRLEVKNTFLVGADGTANLPMSYIYGILIGGGLIGGFINYYVQGGVYHLLVLLSGGKEGFGRSANVYLYGSWPLHIFSVALTVTLLAIKGQQYWTEGTHPVVENLTMVAMIGLIVLTIANRYRASKRIQEVRGARAAIFLVGVPSAFYAVLVGGVIVWGLFVGETYGEPNEQGIAAYNRGDYEEAIALYESALAKSPNLFWEDRATIFRNMAMANLNLGDVEAARANYQSAHDVSPAGSIERALFEGSLALFDNDIRKAISAFQSVASKREDDFIAHNELGLIFLGEYDEGFTDYEKALYHNRRAFELSRDVVTQELLARTLYQIDSYEESEKLFKEILEALPENLNCLIYLGLIAHETNRPTEGVKYFEKAFEVDESIKNGYLLEVYDEMRELDAQ